LETKGSVSRFWGPPLDTSYTFHFQAFDPLEPEQLTAAVDAVKKRMSKPDPKTGASVNFSYEILKKDAKPLEDGLKLFGSHYLGFYEVFVSADDQKKLKALEANQNDRVIPNEELAKKANSTQKLVKQSAASFANLLTAAKIGAAAGKRKKASGIPGQAKVMGVSATVVCSSLLCI
jgi:hypothetical protein